MMAPEGLAFNVKDPYSIHRYLVFASAFCLTLSTLAIATRTFTKAYIIRSMKIEDYSLILAGAGFVGFTGVILAAGHEGPGRHQWDTSVAGAQRVAYLANILEIVYPPTMFAAKFAVLLQIQRIFAANQKNFTYWVVRSLIAANFLTYLATFVVFIFACWPREKIWHPKKPGRCISTNASFIATSAINLISDLTILLLPVVETLKLHMPLHKKIGVAAVFVTGAFACLSSAIRLVYSVRLSQTHDIMWAIAPVGIWSLAEFATVIFVACLPTLPRLLQYIRGKDSTAKASYGTEDRSRAVPKRTSAAESNKQNYIPLDERNQSTPLNVGTPTAFTHPARIQKQVDIEIVTQ